MANEYLRRTPTSSGNRRVWTWSAWHKRNSTGGYTNFYTTQSVTPYLSWANFNADDTLQLCRNESATVTEVNTTNAFRDTGSWMHLMIVWDTTQSIANQRCKLYVNGVLQSNTTGTYPTQNYSASVNAVVAHTIGTVLVNNSPVGSAKGEYTDIFLVDGKALTPEVFGFYKDGTGYISSGSAQATDFRNGQWVPRKPSNIIQEINDSGGFGVNGFYLPMNDSSNFGADFHCTPNSIITLKGETSAQPRNGAPTTTDNYVSQLRADPFKDYLVLALPFVSGGLQNGLGDYSALIKGSGSAKTITNVSSTAVTSVSSYYGSSVYLDGTNYLTSSSADFAMGTGDFTVEGWIYQSGGDTTNGGMFSTQLSNGTGIGITVARNQVWLGNNTITYGTIESTFWPLNQWTHIAVTRSGTTMRVFTDGVCVGITTVATGNIDRQNAAIGRRYFDNASFTPVGHIQDLRVYKGVAKYTSGFDVPKPYTPISIATWRAVSDTTQNNFPTFDPLNYNSSTTELTNGNLRMRATQNNGSASCTFRLPHSGKYYFEIYEEVLNVTTTNYISIDTESGLGNQYRGYGYLYQDGAESRGFKLIPQGTIVGVACNVDDGTVTFYNNGELIGTVKTSSTLKNASISSYLPRGAASYPPGDSRIINFGQNPSFCSLVTAGTFTDASGKGLFKYQPPAGFLALCEDNLPTPPIKNPGDHFKALLYAGDGSQRRSITGLGFKPDLVWIKGRGAGYYHELYDSIRNPGVLFSNVTDAETTINTLNSFDSDGFTISTQVGYNGTNGTGQPFVAWCWKAGNQTTTNNTGSIISNVNANQTAGFSIVGYTGTGSAATIGHGLGKVPAFALFKYRSGPTGGWSWIVYHRSLSTNNYVYLQSTVAQQTLASVFTSAPTSTTFNLGTEGAVNTSGNSMICYAWSEIDGFSKFGSYTGNGSTNGPFVYCGFKPALVMIKRTNDVGNWQIYDSSRGSTNPDSNVLFPNLANVEASGSGYEVDLLSSGFKLRSTDTDRNASNSTYIFAAFAESPFKYSNSK